MQQVFFMLKITILSIISFFSINCCYCQTKFNKFELNDSLIETNSKKFISRFCCSVPDDSIQRCFILDSAIYKECWDTLSQINFWRLMINLEPHTAYISVAGERKILDTLAATWYDSLKNDAKNQFKDSIRKKNNLSEGTKLLVTAGRKNFYQISAVLKSIDTAIKIFIQQGVDPWYAQSIILIESPNRLEYSWAGAYGPFQLMKGTARHYGLKTEKDRDERAILHLAAPVAAKYIKESCIPTVEQMLKKHKITYSEQDLWFKLLVLHVYHAGAANVTGLINSLSPTQGGLALIKAVWSNEYKSFRNASQNYSQVALAANLELMKIISAYLEK